VATNLEFIKSASANGVNSVNVTDCFSAKYDVYLIKENLSNANANVNIFVRYINVGGGVVSSSTYDNAHIDLNTYTSFGNGRNQNLSYAEAWGFIGVDTFDQYSGVSHHFMPFESGSYTFNTRQNMGSNATNGRGRKGIGVETTEQQITGIQYFLQSSATCDFSISVFGVV